MVWMGSSSNVNVGSKIPNTRTPEPAEPNQKELLKRQPKLLTKALGNVGEKGTKCLDNFPHGRQMAL